MELDVTYVDGEPVEVEYYSILYGLVLFKVDGSTAVIDEKWNEVNHDNLKEGIEPKVDTEDVIDEVRKLPFVQAVNTRGKEATA